MSGHCPKCGTYHEEDDDRLCGGCAARKCSCVECSGYAQEAGIKPGDTTMSEEELTAKAVISVADEVGSMGHAKACLFRPSSDKQGSHPCTCGLTYRQFLRVEQAMRAAWRKRAEEVAADAARWEGAARKLPEAREAFLWWYSVDKAFIEGLADKPALDAAMARLRTALEITE